MVRASYRSHTGWVAQVAWSPDRAHQFVSGSYDGQVKLWDLRSPAAPLYDMTPHSDRVLCVNWDSSGTVLSGGTDNMLCSFRT